MPKKLAFIQNRVQRGGRFQVTAEMTRVFNSMGIVPDFLCYRSRIDIEEIKRSYGAELQINFIEIPEPTLPFEWNILAFNWSVRKHLEKYDLVINSNNTSFGLKTKTRLISYVHFPRKYRLISPLKSIHFPEGPKKKWLDLANDPFKLAHWFYSFDKSISKGDLQIVNSKFTGDSLLSVYPNAQSTCIYPPVNEVDNTSSSRIQKKQKQVVSLGRFSPDKRQLEQIEIASLLPDFQFYLVGFINNQSYYKKCEEIIASKGLKNVFLVGNASAEERKRLLDESEYFIHNLRNEPFGITSVQAIASGCYPIVHNSGGQKEMIENKAQRFDSLREAVECFHLAERLNSDQKKHEIQAMTNTLSSYSALKFQKDFKELIQKMLFQA